MTAPNDCPACAELHCTHCGEGHDPKRAFGDVEICRLCLAGAEYAVDVMRDRAERAEARVQELEAALRMARTYALASGSVEAEIDRVLGSSDSVGEEVSRGEVVSGARPEDQTEAHRPQVDAGGSGAPHRDDAPVDREHRGRDSTLDAALRSRHGRGARLDAKQAARPMTPSISPVPTQEDLAKLGHRPSEAWVPSVGDRVLIGGTSLVELRGRAGVVRDVRGGEALVELALPASLGAMRTDWLFFEQLIPDRSHEQRTNEAQTESPLCDVCLRRRAIWQHPLGGLRCGKCPRPDSGATPRRSTKR